MNEVWKGIDERMKDSFGWVVWCGVLWTGCMKKK